MKKFSLIKHTLSVKKVFDPRIVGITDAQMRCPRVHANTQTIHFETANIKTALRLEIELRLCQRGEEKKCKFRNYSKKKKPSRKIGEGENF